MRKAGMGGWMEGEKERGGGAKRLLSAVKRQHYRYQTSAKITRTSQCQTIESLNVSSVPETRDLDEKDEKRGIESRGKERRRHGWQCHGPWIGH
jgi:hypothetical protein